MRRDARNDDTWHDARFWNACTVRHVALVANGTHHHAGALKLLVAMPGST